MRKLMMKLAMILAAATLFAPLAAAQELAPALLRSGPVEAEPIPADSFHSVLALPGVGSQLEEEGRTPGVRGAAVGALLGAGAGATVAWGFVGDGWLRHEDTPEAMLAGAVTGATIGLIVDLSIHLVNRSRRTR